MKNKLMYGFSLSVLFLLSSAFTNNSAPFTRSNDTVGGAYILFAGKYGGEISKQEMAGQLEVKVEGCAKGSRITNFTLSVTQGDKKTTFSTNSNVLSAEMRAKLNSLVKGDQFEFRNTRAYWSDEKRDIDVRGATFVVV